jgi:hypothetical protein
MKEDGDICFHLARIYFLGKNFWPFFLVLCVLCRVDWHFAFIYLELDAASHVGKGNLGHCHKLALKVCTK